MTKKEVGQLTEVILPSTTSSWFNRNGSSQKLKNVKQKQDPERQTDWFHSRNPSVSVQDFTHLEM